MYTFVSRSNRYVVPLCMYSIYSRVQPFDIAPARIPFLISPCPLLVNCSVPSTVSFSFSIAKLYTSELLQNERARTHPAVLLPLRLTIYIILRWSESSLKSQPTAHPCILTHRASARCAVRTVQLCATTFLGLQLMTLFLFF